MRGLLAHSLLVEPVVLDYYDPKHGLVRYYWTDREHLSGCSFCDAGVCIQRVESCSAWDAEVVIHNRKGDLS